MYQTPLCIGKNNNPYLKKINLAHNKRKLKVLWLHMRRKLSAPWKTTSKSVLWAQHVLHVKIYSPLWLFVLHFLLHLIFQKQLIRIFCQRPTLSTVRLKKKKKGRGNCWILCFFLWLEHEVLNIWWQQHIWKKKKLGREQWRAGTVSGAKTN